MFGRLVPPNLLTPLGNAVEAPTSIMFIHRWFAWSGLIVVPLVYWAARRQGYRREIVNGLTVLAGLVVLQITLGILIGLSHVNMLIALMHQANAIGLFALAIFFLHQLRLRDAPAVTSAKE
jgi:heme A synthase